MDGWSDGWMDDGCMDGLMDGWRCSPWVLCLCSRGFNVRLPWTPLVGIPIGYRGIPWGFRGDSVGIPGDSGGIPLQVS